MVKQTVATAPGSDVYAGGPVYCLGGRSTVWGLYAPRIFKEKHEKHFPPNISDYLEQGGYEKALELLTNGSQTFTTIYPSNEINANETTYAEGHLNEAIKKFYQSIGKHSKPKVELSALASQFRSEKVYNFPQGAYSTVDYLLDRTYQRDPNLTILLNTEVLTVSKAADTGKLGLKIRSSSNDKTYQVSAKTIILSAGTIGTARIALSSGLQRHIPLVGKGLTDHDIWGVRFHMKLDKKLNDPLKLQCRLLVGGEDVLLNVAINANSFLAREFTGSHYFDEGGNLHHGPPPAGEEYDTVNITIETQALLVDSNEVVDIPSREPVIRMKRRARDSNTAKQEKMQDQMQDLATLIGKALGLGPVAKAPRLTRAGLGAVAHEVGTMRMEGRHDKDFVVDKNLQVRGYDGLYVCDLSIFPFSPPANPSLTLAAIALQLADRLTEMK
ncbi:hypothetical protein GGS20DRAFT_374578 [Poronia punctata]|nr:hypothetical protein GGS20DRAFT_374578 [Poronia punctata]